MQDSAEAGVSIINTMKKVFSIITATLTLLMTSCGKDGGLGLFEKGYVSVNGEKVLQINYGYEADMSTIGLGKEYWLLFEEPQEKGNIDFEELRVRLRGARNQDDGTYYPFTLFITGVPSCNNIYIDGMEKGEDGKYHYTHNSWDSETETLKGTEYTISVRRFSTNSSCSRLSADITVESPDGTVRVVYSGSTPNDGMEYYMD